MPNLIVSVALPVPLYQNFNYILPTTDTIKSVQNLIGCRVLVPFGTREMVGLCLGESEHNDFPVDKLKPITRLLDNRPCIPDSLIQLCQWGAHYYHFPIGEVLSLALPKRLREGMEEQIPEYWQHTPEGKGLPSDGLKRSVKQQQLHQLLLNQKAVNNASLKIAGISLATAKAMAQKGLIELKKGFSEEKPPANLLNQAGLQLSEQQQQALDSIRYHEFGCYLLEGITGSGKTEIYLQAITRVLQAGRQALVLIPEIGLTPQTLSRFQQRFQVPIVELHSNVSEGEREKNWCAARDGRAKIIIGTRLASLCPLQDTGIIIVDEEHDSSFKQQDSFRYSARDLSIYHAKMRNIPIILGSATPSLESLNNALKGRFAHLQLTQRAGNAQLPQLKLVDLRNQPLTTGLSPFALASVKQTLEAGNQAMIFVNRRGYAPALICHQCGWTADCPSCDAKMTLHATPRHLRCHYCDRQKPVPSTCPRCQSHELQHQGLGTEQIEEHLSALFPDTLVLRIDRDSTSRKGAFSEALTTLNKQQPCITVGTQMLAKGHHLPHVTLVVILDADQGLASTDFRGTEKLGQLITQVAGRAGREKHPGKVLIQSHNPSHPLLEVLLHRGYHQFALQLLNDRQHSRLPPFTQIALFKAESKRGENAIELLELARRISEGIEKPSATLSYLGPYPAPIEKVQDRFRYQLQIKTSDRKRMANLLKRITTELPGYAIAKRTRWALDVDAIE